MLYCNDYQINVAAVDSINSCYTDTQTISDSVLFNFSYRQPTVPRDTQYFHTPFNHTTTADLNVYSRRVNNLFKRYVPDAKHISFVCDQGLNRSLFMAMYFLYRIVDLDKLTIITLARVINPELDPFFLQQFLSCDK